MLLDLNLNVEQVLHDKTELFPVQEHQLKAKVIPRFVFQFLYQDKMSIV
jgi:hypothetical protein